MWGNLKSRIRGWRHGAIDTVFGTPDKGPEWILSGALVVLWLLLLLHLSGMLGPWTGQLGAINTEEFRPVEEQAAIDDSAVDIAGRIDSWTRYLGSSSEVPIDDLNTAIIPTSIEREWLDDNVCGIFSPAQSTDTGRAAVAYRIRQHPQLCGFWDRMLTRTPAARAWGAGGGTAVTAIALGAVGAVFWMLLVAFGRTRDAYRRLYVSHHRKDPAPGTYNE